MDVKNNISWSEIGPGFGEPGGTSPPRIPSSPPPPPPPVGPISEKGKKKTNK